MRCPNTTTPRQHLGRKRYRLARREMRCVREEGHEGPCAWEPAPTMTVVVGPTDIPSFTTHEQLDEAFGKGSLGRAVGVEGPIAEPRTPEQIAASDARYRAHLLRRQRAR